MGLVSRWTRQQQVLLNLVLNARDAVSRWRANHHLEKPPFRQHSRRLADSPGKSHASLAFAVFAGKEQTGSWRATSSAQHISNPFSRRKPERVPASPLATVHDIVTRHGGLIHVKTVNRGGAHASGVLSGARAGNRWRRGVKRQRISSARSGKAFVSRKGTTAMTSRSIEADIRDPQFEPTNFLTS